MTDLGSLGKAKVICRLVEENYDVFMELDGKSPFDLIVHKNDILQRVEIKATETRTKANTGWTIQIKKVRPNKTANIITNFSPKQCELLAIYIKPLDKVILIASQDVKTTCEMTILDNDIRLI
jgi:Holliday junction resolvase-like predicted endonuclease